MTFFAEVAPEERGEQVHGQHDDDKHQRRAVGHGAGGFEVGAARGYHVKVVGERHHLVVDARRQLGQEVGRRREEYRRRFARHTSDGEDEARRDVGEGRRQHHAPYRLKFGGSEGEAARAVRIGDGLECLLRGADDQRKREQAEGERTGDNRVSEAEGIDEECHAEETEDDGGDAAEVVGHDADEADDFSVAGVFGGVDGRHYPERECHHHAARDETEGAHYRGEDAAARHAVGRCRGEELPVDDAGSVPDDETEYPEEYPHDDEPQDTEYPESYPLVGSFARHSPLLDCRLEIISAVTLMTIVMMKRMHPSMKSDW